MRTACLLPAFFITLHAMNSFYNDFSSWIRTKFPFRVQKISIDAGFSCPNRDGRIGSGGCIYCDNRTFNPAYCDRQKSVSAQLEEGKAFFARKYPDMKYLAYFQAFTNTYAPLNELMTMYEEALRVEDVVGLVIGTRPDCISDALLDCLAELNKRTFVLIEYGIESVNDQTLARINRHIILGRPGEDAAESIRQAPIISSLPLDILKIHQMQIIRGTQLAFEYLRQPFHVYSVEEYIKLVAAYLSRLRPTLVLERFVSQSPADLLIAPKWGLKNYEFTNLLHRYLKEKNIRQGAMLKN